MDTTSLPDPENFGEVVTDTRPADLLAWRKSSYSGYDGECVETALTQSVLVRDSKAPYSGVIDLSPVAWNEFIQALKVKHSRRGQSPM
ncbi:DUF397 domain-containing protein [Streptomyces violascens]|uniref:DUF397 domain-containing protein n=1 Tax=Streptomyces violascens TaxID=67381 RepID=UPI00369C22B7